MCNAQQAGKYNKHAPFSERLRFLADIQDNGCWVWLGKVAKDGYGHIGYKAKNWLAHRAVYDNLVGPIPNGLVLDHLCRNRSCVNPAHLEPVTIGENTRRGATATKTHCKNGHPLSGENLRIRIWRGSRARICRTCEKAASRRANEKARAHA